MPPRRRRNSHKNELDRISKLAATLGMNVDNLLEEVPLTDIGEDALLRAQLEAESVLYYIECKGYGFSQKNCKNCKGSFLATYRAIAYCSDICRAEALAEQGIIWNFARQRDSDRWDINHKKSIPKVIGAAATEVLQEAGLLNVDHEV